MLSYNDIKPRKYILLDGDPYEVLSSKVFRKQKRKPVNQTKLKHLVNGSVTERSFHQSETVEEAELDKKDVKFLYHNDQKGEWWFCSPDDPKDRFEIAESAIGDAGKFLKENETFTATVFDEEIVGISLPIKMTFEVTEAPPNVKGNTASGGNKVVTIETGAQVTTPMFIETGDTIEVNTETGEYSQRVSK